MIRKRSLDKTIGLVKSPYSVWKNLHLAEQHQLFFFIFDKKIEYSKKEGYRNDKLPSAITLFEDFATSDCLDVEMVALKPHP